MTGRMVLLALVHAGSCIVCQCPVLAWALPAVGGQKATCGHYHPHVCSTSTVLFRMSCLWHAALWRPFPTFLFAQLPVIHAYCGTCNTISSRRSVQGSPLMGVCAATHWVVMGWEAWVSGLGCRQLATRRPCSRAVH